MTEQTEGAEGLRRVLVDQHIECGRVFVGVALARAVLTSDWLAAREAAAEARGAERALREAADEGPLHFAATHRNRDARGWNVVEADWLRARAAAAAAGGGGEDWHLVVNIGDGVTVCCGRPVTSLPPSDGLTEDAAMATCAGADR
jgi:hypothetical protein